MPQEDPIWEDEQSENANKLADGQLQSGVSNKLLALVELIKTKPLISLISASIILILLFYCFSESKTDGLKEQKEERTSRSQISGVERAVDPRAKWTEEVLNEVKLMQNKLESLIEAKSVETKTQIDDFKQKLALFENQPQPQILPDEVNPNHLRLQDLPNENQEQVTPALPTKKRLGYVKRVGSGDKKDVKDYITTGSFARAVLLTGVVVGTGTNNAASPEPIMLRLVDTAIFSKEYKTEQIKEAILIGSCSGDISSERAKCRLETVSLLNRNGEIIEKPVEGWLIGEDGRPGVKGLVVDRSSEVARMAILNGVLGGIAQFLQNQATNGIFPISPITGQQHALKGKDSLKAGVYAGSGNALEKLADFAIKRAESMSPVIVVASGRVIDVVFRKGFDLNQDKPSDESIRLLPPTTTDYSQNRTNSHSYQNSDEETSHVSSFSNSRQERRSQFSKANAKLKERFIKENEEEEDGQQIQNNLNNVNWQEQLEQPSSPQGSF